MSKTKQILFHGTHVLFNKFSLDNFGKTQGVSRFGYGSYFTPDADLAIQYRNESAHSNGVCISYKNRSNGDIISPSHVDYDFIKMVAEDGYDTVNSRASDESDHKAISLLQKYFHEKEDSFVLDELRGVVYEVSAPSKDSLLPWDDIIVSDIDNRYLIDTFVPDYIIKAVERIAGDELIESLENYIDESSSYVFDSRDLLLKIIILDHNPDLKDHILDLVDREIYQELRSKTQSISLGISDSYTGQHFYQYLEHATGSIEKASEFMKDLGIPGCYSNESNNFAGNKNNASVVVCIWDLETVEIKEARFAMESGLNQYEHDGYGY